MKRLQNIWRIYHLVLILGEKFCLFYAKKKIKRKKEFSCETKICVWNEFSTSFFPFFHFIHSKSILFLLLLLSFSFLSHIFLSQRTAWEWNFSLFFSTSLFIYYMWYICMYMWICTFRMTRRVESEVKW